ncbi:MAG TPA: metallopeptidase family protein [Clostridia bacterium]|nr:metallopeptidase family protein [Clostridia bacterium]
MRYHLPMPRLSEQRFMELVADALDSLPHEFRKRMKNVAVLVENLPPESPRRLPRPRGMVSHGPLMLGQFIGTPATKKSVFDLSAGPDRVILYQRNIEAVCGSEAEIQQQIRLTVIHEVGHYFGLSEDELRHV